MFSVPGGFAHDRARDSDDITRLPDGVLEHIPFEPDDAAGRLGHMIGNSLCGLGSNELPARFAVG